MVFGVFARSARLRRLYASVDYIKKEDVAALQEAAGLHLVQDEATAVRELQGLFVMSLDSAAFAEGDMSPSEVVKAARRISAGARSFLAALGHPEDPAEYTGGRDYALGTYPGPTAETLLLTSATAAYRSRAIAAEINSGDKTAFPTPDTDIPSITAAAARHPFFRLNGQRIRNNSSQDFKNIILSYSMSERMIEITPHFVALILSVSEDLQRSPQIVAREFSLGPAKNNFHREFRRAFFIFATHAYHGMFGVRPKTADAKREPNGPATRWVSRLIHIGAARFSSTYPALLQDGAVEDRRWLELAEAAMLDTDLLKAAVKASHLNESWKRWHPPIKQLTR